MTAHTDPEDHTVTTPNVRVVECDDHIGQHVLREAEGDEPECTNPVDFPDFEHACTDIWSIGWYLCTCGEPWLNQAQRCMTQPGPLGYRADAGGREHQAEEPACAERGIGDHDCAEHQAEETPQHTTEEA